MYTILSQRWPGKATYYGQLERINHDTMRIDTLFTCWHRHRTFEGAQHCPNVVAARNADLEAHLIAAESA